MGVKVFIPTDKTHGYSYPYTDDYHRDSTKVITRTTDGGQTILTIYNGSEIIAEYNWDRISGYKMDKETFNYLDSLLNLLAYIHRDGGHYVKEHGIEVAYQDAIKIVTKNHGE